MEAQLSTTGYLCLTEHNDGHCNAINLDKSGRFWFSDFTANKLTLVLVISVSRVRIFVVVKGSHRPRPLTRFECFEYVKRRGHGRRGHAPD